MATTYRDPDLAYVLGLEPEERTIGDCLLACSRLALAIRGMALASDGGRAGQRIATRADTVWIAASVVETMLAERKLARTGQATLGLEGVG